MDLESPPRPGPTAGSDPPGSDGDDFYGMEEDEESEEFDGDESVCDFDEPPTGN